LASAKKIFLTYGFHGTTMQRIAIEARVNKSVIHYYFRSKEKLYQHVIDEVAQIILQKHNSIQADILLFIIYEMRNNRTFFINSLNESVQSDWTGIIKNILSKSFSSKDKRDIIKLLVPSPNQNSHAF
jgi:AcrR family transcriptional regulator